MFKNIYCWILNSMEWVGHLPYMKLKNSTEKFPGPLNMQFFIYSSISKDLSFSGNSAGKESFWNSGDPGSIPGSGRSPGERIGYWLQYSWASLVAQMVKDPFAMWKTWLWSLGWEDPLEEGMATHSSVLAWRIPWTEEPSGLQSMGSQRVVHSRASRHKLRTFKDLTSLWPCGTIVFTV